MWKRCAAVAFRDDSERLIGDVAKNQAALNPTNTISVGADADEDRIPVLIAPRRKKLASVRSGGGGIVVAAAAETKKEEKVEEKEEFDYRYLYPKHEAEYKAGKASGKSERITITSEKGKVKSSLKKDNNVKEKIGACTVTP
ncbi:heat shock protein 70 family protein [Tanacetum coccineum]